MMDSESSLRRTYGDGNISDQPLPFFRRERGGINTMQERIFLFTQQKFTHNHDHGTLPTRNATEVTASICRLPPKWGMWELFHKRLMQKAQGRASMKLLCAN